jgi:peroxiredoxin
LQSEYESIASHNTEVVYVNPMDIDRTQEYLSKSKVKSEEIKFSVVIDPDRKFVAQYSLEKPGQKFPEAYPSSVLIDKNGILRFKYIGMVPSDRPPLAHLLEIIQLINSQ